MLEAWRVLFVFEVIYFTCACFYDTAYCYGLPCVGEIFPTMPLPDRSVAMHASAVLLVACFTAAVLIDELKQTVIGSLF